MTVIAVSSGLAPIDTAASLIEFEDHGRYPGSIWYHGLAVEAAGRGHELIGAAAGLARVAQGTLKPHDLLVVQERESRAGLRLIELGARGAVLTCLESAVYASKFYVSLPAISGLFHASFLFPPYVAISRATVSLAAFFPRDLSNEHRARRQQERQGCAVVATFRGPLPTWTTRSLARLAVDSLRSPLVRKAAFAYAMSTRRSLLESLSDAGDVYIYGRGWPAARQLSPAHPERVHLRGPVDSKEAVLGMHRFNLCLENTRVAGYVTEKFADAVAAGCVPVYDSENLRQAAQTFDAPFVDAQVLLDSTDPIQIMERAAEQFDQWLAAPGSLAAFLSQFDYREFARSVMQRIDECSNFKS